MINPRYRAFSVAAYEKSLSHAAEILNYSPSGVSQLISALEKEFGFPLFERSKNGLTLTNNGEAALPVIREILNQEENLQQIISGIHGLSVGAINIGAYSSIASHWLPSLINMFNNSYPGIKINMMEGIHQKCEDWLNNRTVDLAFFSYKKNMNYDWIPLADDMMVAVLPKDHPRASDKSYPIREAAKESFIMPAQGHDDDVIALLKRYRIQPKIAYSTLENFAALALIEQGLGMSIMNDLITHNYKCDVVKLPLDPPESIKLGIAVPSLENASPAVKRFIEFAKQKFSS